MKDDMKLTVAKVTMVAICLLAIFVSAALPDLDRIRAVDRPLSWALVGLWLVTVLWTAGSRRTTGFVLLMVASALGLALAFWSLGYVGGAEAVVGGIVAALLGTFGPLGGRRADGG